MQDTVTSRELFERMPTRPALAEPEVAAHKVRSYEDDSTDWAPSGGRAAAPEQPAQPARRRPVRSTRNRDPVYTGQKTIGGTAPKRSAPLVRVGTELRFELIAKPALGSHVHGADPRSLRCPITGRFAVGGSDRENLVMDHTCVKVEGRPGRPTYRWVLRGVILQVLNIGFGGRKGR